MAAFRAAHASLEPRRQALAEATPALRALVGWDGALDSASAYKVRERGGPEKPCERPEVV